MRVKFTFRACRRRRAARHRAQLAVGEDHAVVTPTPAATFVTTAAPASSVRCTGHLPAISISLSASAASTPPSTLIVRSNRSILPVRPSTASPQSWQCSTGTLPWLTRDDQAAERKLLVLGIDAQRHGCACPESDRQIVVGARAAVETADRSGLVGEQTVAARGHGVLESACAALGDDDAIVASWSPGALQGGSAMPTRQ